MRLIVLLSVACGAVLSVAAPAMSAGPTTVERTIKEGTQTRDNRLEYGPGESYLSREELAQADPARVDRRSELIHLGQISDFQLPDEESPLRLEFLDELFNGAYRPEEALAGQVIESMSQRLNGIESPVNKSKLDSVVATGDLADSNQLNETRLFIDTLDGGKAVNPDSGRIGLCSFLGGWSDIFGQWNTRYAGVRGGDLYYEPDRSGPGIDGAGYSNSVSENRSRANRSVALRDFPGLFEAAQRSFQATGLGAPWYSVMGNHDGLVQGTIPTQPDGWLLNSVATGCLKLAEPGTLLQNSPVDALDSAYRTYTNHPSRRAGRRFLRALKKVFGTGKPWQLNSLRSELGVRIVPDDPGRRLLTKEQWVQQHSATTGTPIGHGFNERPPGKDIAYYSTVPKPGTRFIVLDSVNDQGLSEGRIDDAQFRWLTGQVQLAKERGELVIVFAHHTFETMNNGLDFRSNPPDYHFGKIGQSGLPPHSHGESLESLFLRSKNVVAFVAGHEHENRVTPYSAPGKEGSFWEIDTAAHIDAPGQSRLVQLFDNRDGTLSIFTAMVDHGADPDPGDSPTLDNPLTLASIAREQTFNDKQADTGEDGRKDARGRQLDRNVELLLPDPRQ